MHTNQLLPIYPPNADDRAAPWRRSGGCHRVGNNKRIVSCPHPAEGQRDRPYDAPATIQRAARFAELVLFRQAFLPDERVSMVAFQCCRAHSPSQDEGAFYVWESRFRPTAEFSFPFDASMGLRSCSQRRAGLFPASCLSDEIAPR